MPYGEDALLNETAEIERRALEEAERTSPGTPGTGS
jgi:hypothetical protein